MTDSSGSSIVCACDFLTCCALQTGILLRKIIVLHAILRAATYFFMASVVCRTCGVLYILF